MAIASGAAFGQLILVVAAPLLGRLYDPAAFGVFSVVNAVVFAVGAVASLRFEMAVPLPADDSEARRIVRLGWLLTGALALLGTPLVHVSRGALASLTGWSTEVVDLLVWSPLGAAMLGAYLVMNQLAVRQRAYGAIARRNVLQASVTVALQVGLGLAGWGPTGLVTGLIVGQAAGVAALVWSLRHELLRETPDPVPMRRLISRYRTFPLLLAPSGLINSLGIQAPLLALTSLYGTTAAGSLGMAQRVLTVPVALIGVAMSQVLMGELAARKRGGSTPLMPLFRKVTLRLVAVGVTLGVVVVVTAPTMFAFFLGEEWRTSGHMARGLGVGLVLQLVAAPLSQSAILAGKNVAQFLWDLGRLCLGVLVVVVAAGAGLSDVVAVWCLGAATAVSYAVSWLVSRWAVASIDQGMATARRP